MGCQPVHLDAIDLAAGTLTTDLIAHYTFDDGEADASTTVVSDSSGNGHDGVLVGGTWIADGRFGGALHFDGTSYVTVNQFPAATNDFTVTVWVRSPIGPGNDAGITPAEGPFTVVSNEIVFDGGWEINYEDRVDASPEYQAAFWNRVSGGYIHFDCACLTVGGWNHLAFVVDGTAQTLTSYANGYVQGVVAAPTSIGPGTMWLSIGHWDNPGRLFIGDIDDLAIYRRALTGDEIMTLDEHPVPPVF
jgi:hypothetical protein